MGLEFRFYEISLDQQVSKEQLEIDLYDELITITDADPDEQVRLLAVRPVVGGSKQDDKPESIRVTGSLGKELSPTAASVAPGEIAAHMTGMPVMAPPSNGAKS